MANLNRLFNVKISRQSRAASYGVFGVGLILSPAPGFYGVTMGDFETITAADVAGTVKTYTEYDQLVEAGVSGAALKAANRYFAQSPTPDTLVVADIADAFNSTCIVLNGESTGADGVIAAVATVIGGGVKHATFDGTGWTGTAVDADAIKEDENNTDRFQVLGRVVFVAGAGVSVGLSEVKPGAFARVIAAVKAKNNNWFMAMTTSRNPELLTQVADWIEAQPDKMSALVDDGGAIFAQEWPKGGITQYLFDNQMSGSFAITTRIEDNYVDAAIAGRCLTMQPGSETWAIKSLAAAQPDEFTEDDYQTIKAINGNTYEDYGSGVIVTYPGTVGDGESIESVRFCFWLRDYMQKNLATMFINQKKVGNNPKGIESVCQNMEASLKKGQDVGGIMEDFTDDDKYVRGYTVTRPTMANITAADRIKGNITIPFNFYLNHAIKHVDAIGDALTYGV